MEEDGSLSQVGREGGSHWSSVFCVDRVLPSTLIPLTKRKKRKKKLELGALLFPLNVNHASYYVKYYKY